MNGYETEELRRSHILALLRERAGFEQVGNAEGVKAVDEQLRAFGYEGATRAARAEKRPAVKKATTRAAAAKPAESAKQKR